MAELIDFEQDVLAISDPADHHRYCVSRARRTRRSGNERGYSQWMMIAGLKKGDPIVFSGFRASFVGVLYRLRHSIVYEINGVAHRIGVEDLP
jgi:hypothetical protein